MKLITRSSLHEVQRRYKRTLLGWADSDFSKFVDVLSRVALVLSLVGIALNWLVALVLCVIFGGFVLTGAIARREEHIRQLGEMFVPSFGEAQAAWRKLDLAASSEVIRFLIRGTDAFRVATITATNIDHKPITDFSHAAAGDTSITEEQLRLRYVQFSDPATKQASPQLPGKITAIESDGRNFRFSMPLTAHVPAKQVLGIEYAWTWPGAQQRAKDYVFAFAAYKGGTKNFTFSISFLEALPEHIQIYRFEENHKGVLDISGLSHFLLG
jgi:hypothetical protein